MLTLITIKSKKREENQPAGVATYQRMAEIINEKAR